MVGWGVCEDEDEDGIGSWEEAPEKREAKIESEGCLFSSDTHPHSKQAEEQPNTRDLQMT
jgi:hypothetical protein